MPDPVTDTTSPTIAPTAPPVAPPQANDDASDAGDPIDIDSLNDLVSSDSTDMPTDETAATEGGTVAEDEAAEPVTEDVTDPDASAVSDVEADEQAVPTAEASEPEDETLPATPAVETPEAKQQREQVEAADKAFTDRKSKYETDQAAYDARVNAEGYEFDPFVDGKEEARLNREFRAIQQVEMAEYRAIVERDKQQKAYNDHWTNLGKTHPHIGAKALREIYETERDAKVAKWGPDAAHAIAVEELEKRINLRTGQHKAKEAAAVTAPKTPQPIPPKRPPVTRGGATVTPKAGQRVPAGRPRTLSEKIDSGAYGDVSKVGD